MTDYRRSTMKQEWRHAWFNLRMALVMWLCTVIVRVMPRNVSHQTFGALRTFVAFAVQEMDEP